MTKPVRLQLSRKSGFKLQKLSRATNGLTAVKVDRTTRWGNPYRVGEEADRALIRKWGWRFKHPDFICKDTAQAVRKFRHCLAFDEAIHDDVKQHLRGKNLACWCKPGAPCHADELLELANR